MSLLDRIFGRKKQALQSAAALTPESLQKIVQDYGACLEASDPAPGCVADINKLPHPKQHIKLAIVVALRLTDDPRMKEHLKFGYISLANWQAGVGEHTLGIDTTKLDLGADTVELAKQVAAQSKSMEKWSPLIQTEEQALKAELQQLCLW
jgi:hypothetical protein